MSNFGQTNQTSQLITHLYPALSLWFGPKRWHGMTCLLALTDKVLRESGWFSARDLQAQAKQAEMFVGFLNRTAVPVRLEAAP